MNIVTDLDAKSEPTMEAATIQFPPVKNSDVMPVTMPAVSLQPIAFTVLLMTESYTRSVGVVASAAFPAVTVDVCGFICFQISSSFSSFICPCSGVGLSWFVKPEHRSAILSMSPQRGNIMFSRTISPKSRGM